MDTFIEKIIPILPDLVPIVAAEIVILFVAYRIFLCILARLNKSDADLLVSQEDSKKLNMSKENRTDLRHCVGAIFVLAAISLILAGRAF